MSITNRMRERAPAIAWQSFALVACTFAFSSAIHAATPERGALSKPEWPKTASMAPADLRGRLQGFEEGKWILKNSGEPVCGVDVYHYQFHTVDGAGKPTTASSALMVPTGNAPQCSGSLPVVISMHGTTPDRAWNLADLSGKNVASARAVTYAGTYAAQGYIVVAPNYAGYDTSALDHHPYLNADQQSKDVIDALAAARSLLPKLQLRTTDKMFLTGYSQGGYVAMAVHRAMEAAGMPVTASMPSSGAYALAATVDDIFVGRPNFGATIYFPMALRGYQQAYGSAAADLGAIYNPRYTPDIGSLLPSLTPFPSLVSQGKLPATAIFSRPPRIWGPMPTRASCPFWRKALQRVNRQPWR